MSVFDKTHQQKIKVMFITINTLRMAFVAGYKMCRLYTNSNYDFECFVIIIIIIIINASRKEETVGCKNCLKNFYKMSLLQHVYSYISLLLHIVAI